MKTAIITGGSGFVGAHLIHYLVEEKAHDSIIIADIKHPKQNYTTVSTEISFIRTDVRKPIDPVPFRERGCDSDTVIYNLAAICRIPGYPGIDYFHTNITGAETVCKLAEDLGCKKIIFTSSIAPYGASEELKTEESIPQPDNPYGSSKLTAEYIHKGWQQRDPHNHTLAILRPGIIFGKGEQANFTRLYESQKRGFFVYPGRRNTKKACVYVKDVARACYHFCCKDPGIYLFNLVYEEPPSIEEICLTVAEQTGVKKPFTLLPGPVLLVAAYCIMTLGKVIGKNFTGVHPDRVRKIMISTNVSGRKLSESGFKLIFSLSEGIKDWYADCEGKLA